MANISVDGPGTLLCLVRHGETDWNRSLRRQGQTDIPLNELGRAQARLLGAFLARWHWDAVVSSPLSRAGDTAWAIARSIGAADVRLVPDLVEVAFGDAEGLTPEESRLRWHDDDIPGRESRVDLASRAIRALSGLASEYAGRRLIVVSHGGLLNSFLSVVSDGEIGSGRTFLENASVSLVRRIEDVWRLEAHNLTSHLVIE